MPERHDDQPGNGPRMTTGEFRAAPDISASTAQFRAFADDRPDDTRTWAAAQAPSRSPAKMAMLVGGIVVLAIIVILVVALH
jgi:hypothetical protein